MSTTLKATFATRRDAEMAVERLVQEHGVERSNIFVAAEGVKNSAGEREAGSDTRAGDPSPADRDDAALNGRIEISVNLEDSGQEDDVREAFAEFSADKVSTK